MSKVEAQRAMRDARYARYAASRAAATPVPGKAAAAVPGSAASPVPATDPVSPAGRAPEPTPAAPAPVPDVRLTSVQPGPGEQRGDEAALCGHRSINNKSCRRPSGHVEKNHRYA